MAKTAAERMREYRQRMSNEQKNAGKGKNAEQHRKYRSLWDDKKKREERTKTKKRMQKMREKRKKALSPSVSISPSQAFRSTQSLGKAVRRVSNALPHSPRKKVCVVKKLAEKFCVSSRSTQSRQSRHFP